MEEPPSIDQLVVGENTVNNVWSALGEEEVLSLEVADMSPEIAGEVMVTSANVRNTCLKLETKILIRMNRFKRELCPPDPVPVPEVREVAAVKKAGAFKFEKRTIPRFGGTLREYPTFKKDWTTHVAPQFDELAQLYELKTRVPNRVRLRVEKFTTMDQFWKFMDSEYGDEDELVCDCLAYLKQYRHSKDSRSDAQKFWGMYERFHEV